jgi:phenylacetate-coenzyme A ligase PaaK-like adenylate-forming protein
MGMLEPLIRENLPRLQGVYDRCPSPARNFLTSARGWVLTRIRNAPETFELLRELRTHESWSADEIAEFQLCQLQRALNEARRTVPFYKDYAPLTIRNFDDWRRLPVVDRETVRQNQDRLLSNAMPSFRRIGAATTGTTGANLKVAYTEELARENWAFTLRQWAWAGVEPRQPRITLFGARIVPPSRTAPPFWTHNLAERQVLLSIFHLSAKTAPAYLDFLSAQRGKILEGFPSVLGILADFALQRGQIIPMRVVFTTGEPLYPALREKIEKAFGARAFDSYGMTEYCGMIHECECGQMHLIPEYGFLEILNDRDEPVGPNEEGDFVWTGFRNAAMPLIRYRIGDHGRWQGGDPCACGRHFSLVVPTITRESDILRCPDGRLFSPRALNQLLKHATSLRFCQFVQDRAEHVVIRVVAGNGGAREDASEICMRLQGLLGTGMHVESELAAEPLTRAGGKIPLILNQVPR